MRWSSRRRASFSASNASTLLVTRSSRLLVEAPTVVSRSIDGDQNPLQPQVDSPWQHLTIGMPEAAAGLQGQRINAGQETLHSVRGINSTGLKRIMPVRTSPGCRNATAIPRGFKSIANDLPAMFRATFDIR